MKSNKSQEKNALGLNNFSSDGFFDRLKELYPYKNQEEIAEIIGVTPSALTAYKRKGRLPKTDRLMVIASENRVSLQWLIAGQGPKGADDLAALVRLNTDRRKVETVLPVRLPSGIYQSLVVYCKSHARTPEEQVAELILRALIQDGSLTIQSFRQ